MVTKNPECTTKPIKGKERTKKLIKTYYFYEDELLGKGTSGSVFRGYDTNKLDSLLAIKVVPCKAIDTQGLLMLNREVEILYMIKGDSVVKLIDTAQTANNFYILMEYCNGRSLENWLQKNIIFSESGALNVLKQIVNAFIDLNKIESTDVDKKELAIIHRDLKPANLIFHNGKLKIADFGYAKIVNRVNKSVQMEQTYCGTPLYCCPQILKNTAYSYKCDIWSAGCIFYECLFGKVPFKASTEVALVELMEKGLFIPKDMSISFETEDLLKKILTFEDEKRMSWVEIMNHPALKK